MTREEYIDFANALKNNYTIDFDKLPEFCDMAISAISEGKRDLISRGEVESVLHNNLHALIDTDQLYQLYKDINRLPIYSSPDSAENKWIPVSERLPEKEKENYLIDYEYEGEEHITVSFYDKYGFWSSSEVRAWQPLPEPYKAESEGTE